jgi:hypothetical protein
MLNLLNHRRSFILLALLGCTTFASSAGLPSASSSDPAILRGTDVGKFTTSPSKDPKVVVTSDHAVGESTTVGSFSLNAGEHINLQTLSITEARFTITAANGDKLMGTYNGTAHLVGIPNVIEYDVSGPISGGTGHFEGATGAIVFHGTADLGQGTFKDEVLAVLIPEK